MDSKDICIELTLAEVKALARSIGFRIQEEKTLDSTYVSNKDGMLQVTFLTDNITILSLIFTLVRV